MRVNLKMIGIGIVFGLIAGIIFIGILYFTS